MAGIRRPRAESNQLGVIEVGEGTRIASFKEKPAEAAGLRDAPDEIFASMGNYVFTTKTLIDIVSLDAEDQNSHHDIGGSIIPALVDAGEAHVYDFTTNHVAGETERDHAYWRDVGSLDSYYDSHMDLVSVHPIFNLYNREWPIGAGAVVRNAIIDKNVHVPPGAQIGIDPILDKTRFTVSPNGIVVIGKGEKVPEG